jgi:hypothetical protein
VFVMGNGEGEMDLTGGKSLWECFIARSFYWDKTDSDDRVFLVGGASSWLCLVALVVFVFFVKIVILKLCQNFGSEDLLDQIQH